jgi:hypothetical protein
VPDTAGATVLAGGAGATGSVSGEVAFAVPAPLVATTFTRSVEPTSAGDSAYVAAVAPVTSTQPEPADEQRRHW